MNKQLEHCIQQQRYEELLANNKLLKYLCAIFDCQIKWKSVKAGLAAAANKLVAKLFHFVEIYANNS